MIHKNFKGQFDDEQVLCFFRKHWITVLPRLIALFILLFVLGLNLFYFKVLAAQDLFIKTLILSAHILITYLVHQQFLSVFQYFLHCTMITNYRIVCIDKSVFFRDSKDSVDLSKIQDIRKIQNGMLENVFNFGTLMIVLSGTHAAVNINLVPRPDYQFKKINKVKQMYWHQREMGEPVHEEKFGVSQMKDVSSRNYVELVERF